MRNVTARTLSVACDDSAPKGRAKGVHKKWSVSVPIRSMGISNQFIFAYATAILLAAWALL